MWLMVLKYWRVGAGLAVLVLFATAFIYVRHVMNQNKELAQSIQSLKTENSALIEEKEKIIKSQKVRDTNVKKTKSLAPAAVISGLDSAGWLRD